MFVCFSIYGCQALFIPEFEQIKCQPPSTFSEQPKFNTEQIGSEPRYLELVLDDNGECWLELLATEQVESIQVEIEQINELDIQPIGNLILVEQARSSLRPAMSFPTIDSSTFQNQPTQDQQIGFHLLAKTKETTVVRVGIEPQQRSDGSNTK
ncbi:MAG: hypothetical protein V1695_00105 [Candidatus Uhrbacteria bacterium]